MATIQAGDGHSALHGEPAEVVAQRQLVGVWLFIAGDAVIVGSLLFTYLYLRGLNTEKQWMPPGAHGASLLLAWGVVLAAAASLGALRRAEQTVERGGRDAVAIALGASFVALVAAGLGIVAISKIPLAVNAVSQVRQVAGSYASALLAIDLSNVAHLVLLALLGVAVAVRTAKGVISASNPLQARLVRIFWAWVTLAIALSAAITTAFVTSPR